MPDSADTPLNYCDQRGVPEWGTGPDGRPVRIADDPRLPGLYREWLADACTHPETVVIERKDSLGRLFYSPFCNGCGKLLRSHLPKRDVGLIDGRHADDMFDLNARYTAERDQRLTQIANACAERMQPANRETYDDYLRSPAWKRRAAKVMDRANNRCEGCLTNAADEVHHLTYSHMGNEFAFQLVALCEPCHRRYHARSAA
jgi:hypothetical protein